MPAICGIYGIKNKIDGKIYIGQSVNVNKRHSQHKNNLKNNCHKNNHLQRSYNKYGLEFFEFIIIEECDEDNLTTNEQKWIDYFGNIAELYNKMIVVENSFKHSKETKLKISEIKSKKLTKDKVLEIVDLLKNGYYSQKQIANLFQVSRVLISDISCGRRWSNITGGAVIPVIYDNGIKQLSKSHKQRIGVDHKGRKFTKETRQKMAESRKARNLTEKKEEILQIAKLLKETNYSIERIASLFSLSSATISRILNGIGWTKIITGGKIIRGGK